MNLEDFASACSLTSLPELGKVCHLAFFYLKTSSIEEFGSSDAERWLTRLALPAPNRSRLEEKSQSKSEYDKGDKRASAEAGIYRRARKKISVGGPPFAACR